MIGGRIDELGIDTYLVSQLLDASLQYITDPQISADVFNLHRFIFEGKYRVAGNDRQLGIYLQK